MFKNDAQRRKISHQSGQHALDEHRLTIKHVDIGIGNLAVDQQRHSRRFHRGERRSYACHIGNPVCGTGGGMRRIHFSRRKHAVRETFGQHRAGSSIGQVARHQRGKAWPGRGNDPVAVRARFGDCSDWRRKVGHNNRARELASSIRRDGGEHHSVTQMHMPVIRAADCHCWNGHDHAYMHLRCQLPPSNPARLSACRRLMIARMLAISCKGW